MQCMDNLRKIYEDKTWSCQAANLPEDDSRVWKSFASEQLLARCNGAGNLDEKLWIAFAIRAVTLNKSSPNLATKSVIKMQSRLVKVLLAYLLWLLHNSDSSRHCVLKNISTNHKPHIFRVASHSGTAGTADKRLLAVSAFGPIVGGIASHEAPALARRPRIS